MSDDTPDIRSTKPVVLVPLDLPEDRDLTDEELEALADRVLDQMERRQS